MSRRPLIHLALALTLAAGVNATTASARADERSGGHDRNRYEERRQRDGHRDGSRDHAGDHRSYDQHRGGRSYDDRGGSWNDRNWQQPRRYDDHRSSRSYDTRRYSGSYGSYGYNYGYQQPRYRYGYTPGYRSLPGYRYTPTYRYSYGGRYYDTDEYGVRLLRNAINFGYQQGLAAAYLARQSRYGYDYYRGCDAYRNGLYGYEGGYIDQGQYSYYFRLGFERGYREAFYGRGAGYYGGGYYRPGPVDLVADILDVILDLHRLH